MLKHALCAAAVAALVTPAAAGNLVAQPRAEVAYAFVDADEASFNAIGVRAGLDFVKFFGVEAEVFTGITEDEDGPVTFSLDYKAGVYGLGRFPLAPGIDVFARAGVVQAQIEGEFAGSSTNDSETGFAFGAGISGAMLTTPLGWRVDYTRSDIDEFETNEISASLVYRF